MNIDARNLIQFSFNQGKTDNKYNFDEKKLQETCKAEALVNVYDVITQKKEPGKVV